MNTEQKAKTWLEAEAVDEFGWVGLILDGQDIITTLLSERQALLECVKFARDNTTIPTIKQRMSKTIAMCDYGTISKEELV